MHCMGVIDEFASSAVSNAAKGAPGWYQPKTGILGGGWNNTSEEWKQVSGGRKGKKRT